MAFATTFLRNVVMKPQACNRRSLHLAHPDRQRCTVCRYYTFPTLSLTQPLTFPKTLCHARRFDCRTLWDPQDNHKRVDCKRLAEPIAPQRIKLIYYLFHGTGLVEVCSSYWKNTFGFGETALKHLRKVATLPFFSARSNMKGESTLRWGGQKTQGRIN
jgi:hypothetical protein